MTTKPTRKRKPAPPVDYSRPLHNARWEAFALDVFAGMIPTDAYCKHYSTGNMKRAVIHKEACLLNRKVTPRIEWMADQAFEDQKAIKRRLLRYHWKAMEARHGGIKHFAQALPDGELLLSFDLERLEKYGEAIQGLDQDIKVTKMEEGEGDGKNIVVTRKPRFRDYVPVSAEIAKLTGVYAATKGELTGPDGAPLATGETHVHFNMPEPDQREEPKKGEGSR